MHNTTVNHHTALTKHGNNNFFFKMGLLRKSECKEKKRTKIRTDLIPNDRNSGFLSLGNHEIKWRYIDHFKEIGPPNNHFEGINFQMP